MNRNTVAGDLQSAAVMYLSAGGCGVTAFLNAANGPLAISAVFGVLAIVCARCGRWYHRQAMPKN